MQDENIRELFAESIRRLMEARGVKQAELAEAVGATQGAVSGWCAGAIPKGDQLLVIARYFGVTMESLLTGKDRTRDPTGNMLKDAEAIYRISDQRTKEAKSVAAELDKLAARIRSSFGV